MSIESQKEIKSRVRYIEGNGPLLNRLAELTERNAYDTTYFTHGLHSYPAKYIPQLPNLIIREATKERNTILDPFCGSGTTLVEALANGRKSIGIDSNPIACLAAGAKTILLSDDDIEILGELIQYLKESIPERKNNYVPGQRNLNHWFSEEAITDLSYLRFQIERFCSANNELFAEAVFSSIVVSCSRQESETRYVAKKKDYIKGMAIDKFIAKLKKSMEGALDLRTYRKHRAQSLPKIYNSDITKIEKKYLRKNSVDIVITSPPYPNSYDYYLYHKWRMVWLGYDFKEVQKKEIGSRYEHSSRSEPISRFIERMKPGILRVAESLKPAKFAYFFVGDSIVNGVLYNMEEVFLEIMEGTGLELVDSVSYSLGDVSRSFNEKVSKNCHGGAKSKNKLQRILVFQKVNNGKGNLEEYDRKRKKASPKAEKEVTPISFVKGEGETVALKSEDSNRHIHGLGRYPSRFIPEIPEWAVVNYSERGDLVGDPFSGAGTTAVESILAGRKAYSGDVSEYSCLLTKAKTTVLDAEKVKKSAEELINFLNTKPKGEDYPRFDLDDFWFNPEHLKQFNSIRKFIENNFEKDVARLYLAAISTTIRKFSYQDESQIKVKRDQKKYLQGTEEPYKLCKKAVNIVLDNYLNFLELNPKKDASIVRSTSADYIDIEEENKLDLIVTSPPYINAMNYPMSHRYENILLGLIPSDSEKFRAHERQYYGTERVYAKERIFHYFENNTFPTRAKLIREIETIKSKEPKRAHIVQNYFEGIISFMDEATRKLKKGGVFVLVVGRNTIKGVPVDTFEHLSSIAESKGFRREKWFNYEIIKNSFKLTRHKTANIIKTDGVGVFVRE
ncbi:MAG: DNA methyltransferase [Promethearchaeia archaeon]